MNLFDFDIKDVLVVETDPETGTISLQLGRAVGDPPTFDSSKVWQPLGQRSLPAKPSGAGESKQTAQAILYPDGECPFVFGFNDPRYEKLFKDVDYGEWAAGAVGPDGTSSAKIHLRAGNAISIQGDIITIGDDASAKPTLNQTDHEFYLEQIATLNKNIDLLNLNFAKCANAAMTGPGPAAAGIVPAETSRDISSRKTKNS